MKNYCIELTYLNYCDQTVKVGDGEDEQLILIVEESDGKESRLYIHQNEVDRLIEMLATVKEFYKKG